MKHLPLLHPILQIFLRYTVQKFTFLPIDLRIGGFFVFTIFSMVLLAKATQTLPLGTARMLGNRYNPNDDESLQKEIESGFSRMLMIRFDIEHLTGKEAIELVGMRRINSIFV